MECISFQIMESPGKNNFTWKTVIISDINYSYFSIHLRKLRFWSAELNTYNKYMRKGMFSFFKLCKESVKLSVFNLLPINSDTFPYSLQNAFLQKLCWHGATQPHDHKQDYAVNSSRCKMVMWFGKKWNNLIRRESTIQRGSILARH